MKTEFVTAITQLSAERNLPQGVILEALESALVSVYKKDALTHDEDIAVKIDPNTADIKVYVRKLVVDTVTNPYREISLGDAQKLQRDGAQIGELLEIETILKNAGRIAAQAAKQVILQRLREAERHAVYDQFAGKEGEIVTGTIQSIQPKRIYVDLGRAEAVLPLEEQVSSEYYRIGKQFKFYLLQIGQGVRGPQIVISRSHPNLVRRLFELEIPELHSGVVELKTIAREARQRSKVAVSTNQEGVDPIGCCLGPRGIRLQNIINELGGEKIDLIQWNADPKIFISNALSPSQVVSIELNEAENTATVVVPSKQLSLAIGKQGQNARLAARLTGWRIDIKSVSAAEAETARLAKIAADESEKDELPADVPIPSQPEPTQAVSEEVEDITALLARDEFKLGAETPSVKVEGESLIRFAEDILPNKAKEKAPPKKKSTKSAKGRTKARGPRKARISLEDDGQEE